MTFLLIAFGIMTLCGTGAAFYLLGVNQQQSKRIIALYKTDAYLKRELRLWQEKCLKKQGMSPLHAPTKDRHDQTPPQPGISFKMPSQLRARGEQAEAIRDGAISDEFSTPFVVPSMPATPPPMPSSKQAEILDEVAKVVHK